MHIKEAGDWTGALHAKFRASMQLTHSDKGALIENLKRSLARRLSVDSPHVEGLQANTALANQVTLELQFWLKHDLIVQCQACPGTGYKRRSGDHTVLHKAALVKDSTFAGFGARQAAIIADTSGDREGSGRGLPPLGQCRGFHQNEEQVSAPASCPNTDSSVLLLLRSVLP